MTIKSNRVRNVFFALLFTVAFTFNLSGTSYVNNNATAVITSAALVEVAGLIPNPNCSFCYDW